MIYYKNKAVIALLLYGMWLFAIVDLPGWYDLCSYIIDRGECLIRECPYGSIEVFLISLKFCEIIIDLIDFFLQSIESSLQSIESSLESVKSSIESLYWLEELLE